MPGISPELSFNTSTVTVNLIPIKDEFKASDIHKTKFLEVQEQRIFESNPPPTELLLKKLNDTGYDLWDPTLEMAIGFEQYFNNNFRKYTIPLVTMSELYKDFRNITSERLNNYQTSFEKHLTQQIKNNKEINKILFKLTSETLTLEENKKLYDFYTLNAKRFMKSHYRYVEDVLGTKGLTEIKNLKKGLRKFPKNKDYKHLPSVVIPIEIKRSNRTSTLYTPTRHDAHSKELPDYSGARPAVRRYSDETKTYSTGLPAVQQNPNPKNLEDVRQALTRLKAGLKTLDPNKTQLQVSLMSYGKPKWWQLISSQDERNNHQRSLIQTALLATLRLEKEGISSPNVIRVDRNVNGFGVDLSANAEDEAYVLLMQINSHRAIIKSLDQDYSLTEILAQASDKDQITDAWLKTQLQLLNEIEKTLQKTKCKLAKEKLAQATNPSPDTPGVRKQLLQKALAKFSEKDREELKPEYGWLVVGLLGALSGNKTMGCKSNKDRGTKQEEICLLFERYLYDDTLPNETRQEIANGLNQFCSNNENSDGIISSSDELPAAVETLGRIVFKNSKMFAEAGTARDAGRDKCDKPSKLTSEKDGMWKRISRQFGNTNVGLALRGWAPHSNSLQILVKSITKEKFYIRWKWNISQTLKGLITRITPTDQSTKAPSLAAEPDTASEPSSTTSSRAGSSAERPSSSAAGSDSQEETIRPASTTSQEPSNRRHSQRTAGLLPSQIRSCLFVREKGKQVEGSLKKPLLEPDSATPSDRSPGGPS